jgi:hypothetical protein
MKDNVPATAFAKLITLSDAVKYLSEKVIATEAAIASARQRLTGGFSKDPEYDDLRATLDQLVADLPVLKKKLHAAQSVLSSCKAFLDDLPDNATLEPLTVDVSGRDLASVRTKIEAAQSELAHLRALPTSSADIEQRVRAYVEAMARPTITGIGKGDEKLSVFWPGAGWDSNGPREHRADILPLMALLHGDKMVEALMAEIERTTSDVVPIKERATRIAALTDEIEQLAYVEGVLVAAAIANGEDAQRSPKAPQAVLGVRIVNAKQHAA